VAVPLMNIVAIALTGAGNVKALATVFGRDHVVPSSLGNEPPALIGTSVTIILGNIYPVAIADVFHIHALVAVPGGDKIVSIALVRHGPALIRSAMTFPLKDVCRIMRGGAGYIEAFAAVLGPELIGAAGGNARRKACPLWSATREFYPLDISQIDILRLAVLVVDHHGVRRIPSGRKHEYCQNTENGHESYLLHKSSFNLSRGRVEIRCAHV